MYQIYGKDAPVVIKMNNDNAHFCTHSCVILLKAIPKNISLILCL